MKPAKKSTKPKVAIRHGKLKRSSSVKNAFNALLTGVLVLALSGFAVAGYALIDLTGSLNTVSLGAKNSGDPKIDYDGEPIDGAFAIALVGSDTRDGQTGYQDGIEGELNDVNLLLYVDESHENATVISFSRDLMVPIPACLGPNGEEFYTYAESEGQLNSALDKGGLACVVNTLEELTGIDIPYGGLITFDGVINMSNAIGGVEVCLTEPIVDPKTELDLPAGNNTLVGLEALQFLRTRYGVGDGGDSSRIGNQQIFMASMVRQLQSADTFGDPLKVYRLAKAATNNMTLSDSLIDVSVMQSMAMVLKDLDLERINFVQFPVVQHAYDKNRYSPDWFAAEELLSVMVSGQSFEVDNLGTAVQDQSGTVDALSPEGEEVIAGAEEGFEAAIEENESFVAEEFETDEVEDEIDNGEVDNSEAVDTGYIDETGQVVEEGPVKVGPNVKGQSAAKVTCSQGRTVW